MVVPKRTADLSAAQQRLWYMSQLEPESPYYNITLAIKLGSDINLDYLAKALQKLVLRHDILRTCYPIVNGVVHQEVFPASHWMVEEYCFEYEGIDDEEKSANIADAIAQFHIDVENGPVFRAFIVSVSPAQNLLVLLTHHIATDQNSINVMMTELDMLYEIEHQGEHRDLMHAPAYIDYVLFENTRFLQQKEKLFAFWDKQLAKGLEAIALPYDKQPNPDRSRLGREIAFLIDGDELSTFRSWCRREQSTEFAGLLTIWALLLGLISNKSNFFIATATAFREKVKFKRSLGCFINTLAIHHSFSLDDMAFSVLRHNEANIMETFEHRAMTYEKLIERARYVQRKNIGDPVNAYIQYQPRKMMKDSRISENFSPNLNVHNGRAKFPLMMNISDWDSYLHCTIEYEKELFTDKKIEKIKNIFLQITKLVTSQPDIRIGELFNKIHNEEGLHKWNTLRQAPVFEKPPIAIETQAIEKKGVQYELSILWAKLLGSESIKEKDDFFLEGGNSFLLIRLLWQINQQFGLQIPLKDIYQCTRFDLMSALVEENIFDKAESFENYGR
ncbi:phosphopantetheine binding protein [Advenella incenata]|uniref:Phosphopantetheine binding protein n=1 Tax=Advenella incenata TaxID=267800 RepID=A0A4Q7VRH4_9BURK|nr:condensation domain-containing protein [Advenella incenata]RZT99032.1 phosphopantetheine binding protein [Advenella incenata]